MVDRTGEPLAGKVVIDTDNNYPDRDGHINELDEESTTSSELQGHLPHSHVVKAFNTVFFGHLVTLARAHGSPDRSAVPIAGDDKAAKKAVTAFLDAIGHDAYGSPEDPRPADAERLSSLLAQARRHRENMNPSPGNAPAFDPEVTLHEDTDTPSGHRRTPEEEQSCRPPPRAPAGPRTCSR